jgi:anthranilate synthase component 1
MANDLAHVPKLLAPNAPLVTGGVGEDAPEKFLRSVERALEYIAAGDIYQANLSRSWQAKLSAGITPQHLYQRLRETNPAPFSGIVRLDGITIVSSSPERLVSVRDGHVSTRPIAGTRPRGQTAAADVDLARELHGHPKERAEHVMLIDLERNDLGRICEAGTVKVDELMTIESYAHVHHIVSNVSGTLRADATPGDVLRAVFPGGTITGCPKVRCMEIIAELEEVARGAYTGSFGYLNRDGSMDTNILIRTLEVAGDQLTLRAGAGIVADSVPERELAETRAKARGVLRALGTDTEGAAP